jgi:hypothetical protein
MARTVGFNNRFNAGELEPDAWADSDLQQHQHGCALARNWVGLVAGPLARRCGTYFAGLTKVQAEVSVLVPFIRSTDDALALEFGAGYVRVWSPDNTPLLNVGVQVEFATTYVAADLAKLRYGQSGDVIYLTHADGTVKPKRIKRLSNISWVFGDLTIEDGPWLAENSDDTLTMAVSKVFGVGAVMTASAAYFTPGMVGTTFRLRAQSTGAGVANFTPDFDFEADYELIASGGNVYRCSTVGAAALKMGSNPPVHTTGIQNDGSVDWEWLHDGSAIVAVTGYTDATHVTVDITSKMLPTNGLDSGTPLKRRKLSPLVPDNPVFPATKYWAEAAWSPSKGWPTAWPMVKEERLFFGGVPTSPDMVYATATGGFTADKINFHPGRGTGLVVDTDSVRRFAGEIPGKIVWFCGVSFLLCGTTGAEALITGASFDDPISPASYGARILTDYGAAFVKPQRAHNAVLMVAKGGTTVRDIRINPDTTTGGSELSVVAGHITGRGISEMAWQGGATNTNWLRLSDGGLAAQVYHDEQRVFGFTQQQLAAGGWTVESLITLPGFGGRDAIWMIASRLKAGVTQRSILVLAARTDGVFLDSAQLYSGAPTATVAGLGHLEGESVFAKADNAEYRGLVVTAGVVTLPGGLTASKWVVGLNYKSRFESLPLDVGGAGITQGKRQRLTQGLAILTGRDAYVGASAGVLDTNDGDLERVFFRGDGETLALTEKRLAAKVTFSGGASRDPRIVVEYDGVFDLKLHMLRPEVNADG